MSWNESIYSARERKICSTYNRHEREVERGQIWFVGQGKDYMNEQGKARPAIIVSENKMNVSSDRCMVVYQTRQDHGREEHVPVDVKGNLSFAICENINTIFLDRLQNFAGCVTNEKMQEIEKQIRKSLGMDQEGGMKKDWKDKPLCIGCEEKSNYAAMKERAEKAEIERDTYKKMVDVFMNKMMEKG